MAIDYDKLRNKLEQLQNPGSSRKKQLWKPSDEPSTIRLLEYPFGESGDPFVQLYFHYNVGQRSFLCPKYNLGKPCPACDFVKTLYDSEEEEDRKVAKQIRAQQRNYVVVVDRADETLTPKLWGFGKIVYKTLIDYLLNEDYGNYMDPKNGLDLVVQYSRTPGQSWPNTDLKFKRKESPLSEDESVTERILSEIPKVDSIFQPITQSEIKEAINDWLAVGDGDAENASSETTKGGSSSEEESDNEESRDSKEDIDAAFEAALAE